jgi:hypothetical protein
MRVAMLMIDEQYAIDAAWAIASAVGAGPPVAHT